MSLQYPRPHHGHTSEYQASGIPWHQKFANGNNQKVEFPYVTRFVFVTATTEDVSVSFDDGGIAADRFFIIPAGTTSGRLELKCKELHFTSTGPTTILAGLTNVKAADFPDITGLPGIGA